MAFFFKMSMNVTIILVKMVLPAAIPRDLINARVPQDGQVQTVKKV